MTTLTQPANGFKEYTAAGGDFAAAITKIFRKVNCSGGTKFVFKDARETTQTILAADYARFNDQAIWIHEITTATDCTSVFAWE